MGLFDGQVAWVTGGGRGIGRAAALALAHHGAAVAVSSRSISEVNQVAFEIGHRGGRSCATLVDVSDPDMVEKAVREIQEALGPIEILINNAGVLTPLGKLWETDPRQWTRVIDINLSGAYYCMRAVLPGMIRRSRGVIVNVSSGAAISASPGMSAYSASKAGLDHLTRSLATDLAERPIRVYALYPGLTETGMQEIMRTATDNQVPPERRQYFVDQQAAGNVLPPDVPARAIVWLCSSMCDLDNGAVLQLRMQPEYLAKINEALKT